MDRELKQEFEKINERLDSLPTKTDLKNEINDLVGIINETIAEPMEQRFAEIKDTLRVRAEVEALKVDMQKIKAALHLS
ncbi:MAG: hypothetical protein M3362_08000 [Acidobacteriota bacterium]|nr:hypothetical protein [Acidobacteriota bacterium]